jgi:2-keto-4-pentenoate hydratase
MGEVDGWVEQTAGRICEIRRGPERLGRLERGPRDEGEAYAVQSKVHACLQQAGWGDLAGWKIGCTTLVMQRYLGIANPCAGGVFASTVQRGDARFAHGSFVRVGVECEVAVRLGRDLVGPSDRETAAQAVAACMAAIEIVDDRYVDYSSLGAPTLIADDFFGAGAVLGSERADFDPRRLREVRARMLIDGREVGSGVGTDILGEPLEALVWLANNHSSRGERLRAGEIVLLGSLVQTQWIAQGEQVVIENDALGAASALFD